MIIHKELQRELRFTFLMWPQQNYPKTFMKHDKMTLTENKTRFKKVKVYEYATLR